MKKETLVLGAIGVVFVVVLGVWLWAIVHKDIGKAVVSNTNSVVTNAVQSTDAQVAKKEEDTNAKIARVVRRSASDAGSVRAGDSLDPGAFDAWVAGLCANDIYEGYADCTRYRGVTGGKGS